MRAFVVAAALVLYNAAPGSAFDLQTKRGQAVCDTLLAFEELTIAIGMKDDQSINDMDNKGCHLPGPGLRMELIEAYPDQTALLFGKLAEYTRLDHVPDHIERLTNLAKVRVFTGGDATRVGFTLLPVSPHSATQAD